MCNRKGFLPGSADRKISLAVLLLMLALPYLAGVSGQAPSEASGFSGDGLHLYPLGWSSEGRWGTLIGRESSVGNPGIRILVIDAVTDEILYYSEPLGWSGPESFSAYWTRYSALVQEVSAYFDLESDRRPDVRDARFTTGGYNYEFVMNPPSPATSPYTLRIQSSRGDVKDVYTSPADVSPRRSVLLGAMVSPFEERALAIIREDDSYRFSGAHLTLGFAYRQEASGETGGVLSAVFNGQEYLVGARLAAGAGPDEKDERGYTALLVASRLGHWGIVLQLLTYGADPDPRDDDGRGPLHYAAFAGSQEAIRRLLAAGADRDSRDNAGRKPADLAADGTLRALLQ